MKKIIAFCILMVLVGCNSLQQHVKEKNNPIIQTQAGQLQGLYKKGVYRYLGVPYAAVPIGENRFKAPQTVPVWQGVKQATSFSAKCLMDFPVVSSLQNNSYSEDCLYLNVFVPQNKQKEHLPVMVWIHGGGLGVGSGEDNDPSFLVKEKNIIVVTLNYRLGILGFFAHPALRQQPGEGAFAVLDQQAALKWVKQNISAFGGDPQNITLFGQSAGAWSICYQLLSPSAKGLFNRVIMESGNCMAHNSFIPQEKAEEVGQLILQELGCKKNDLECMRNLPASKLLTIKNNKQQGIAGRGTWSPMQGGDVLPLMPDEAFAEKKVIQVPIMIGITKDEGNLFTYLLSILGVFSYQRGYEKIIGREFADPKMAKLIATEYQQMADHSKREAFSQIVTDAFFACSTVRFLNKYPNDGEIYFYQFEDDNAPIILPSLYRLKSYHAAELYYVFGTPNPVSGSQAFTPAQQKLAKTIQDYWTNYAKTGNPNSVGLPTWSIYKKNQPLSLSVNGIKPLPDFEKSHRCDFWNQQNLLPNYQYKY